VRSGRLPRRTSVTPTNAYRPLSHIKAFDNRCTEIAPMLVHALHTLRSERSSRTDSAPMFANLLSSEMNLHDAVNRMITLTARAIAK
jgi:hypothetical protein